MHVRSWIPCRSADRLVDKPVDYLVDKTVGRAKIDTFFENSREKTSLEIKFFIMWFLDLEDLNWIHIGVAIGGSHVYK